MEFRVSDYLGQTHYAAVAFDSWLDLIIERSGGRLKFTRFYGEVPLKGPDTTAGIGKGVVDLGLAGAGYTPAVFPYMMVGRMPYLVRDPYVHYVAVHDVYDTFPQNEENFTNANLKLLFNTVAAPSYLNIDRPIRKVEDLKDLKIRGNSEANLALRQLGANPTGTPYGEVFSALQTGVINGALGSTGDSYTGRWWEVSTYQVDIETGVHIFAPFVWNLDSWNKLPDDIKKMIEDTGRADFLKIGMKVVQDLSDEWLRACVMKGNDVYMFSAAEKAKAWDLVNSWITEEWINEVPADATLRRQVVERYLQVAKENEADSTFVNPFLKYAK